MNAALIWVVSARLWDLLEVSGCNFSVLIYYACEHIKNSMKIMIAPSLKYKESHACGLVSGT